MSGKYPNPPPLSTSESIGTPSETGFQVEFREGYYYISAAPPGCKDLKVGDRVLEINGVKAFNFGSARTANGLFDTVCMVYVPKEELMRKTNGKKKYHDDDSTSSEESAASRKSIKGRRSMYEEEARQIGAQRLSARNLEETLKKERQEEKELRQIEREIRQLQRADRERREDQERRRSRVSLTNFPSIPTAINNGRRPSLLFSPPATSNKKTLRSSIMESISRSPSINSDRKTRASMIEVGQKSPSSSERKRSQLRHTIAVSPAPLTSDPPKKIKNEQKKEKRRSVSPAPLKGHSVSPAPLVSEEPKKKKIERSASPSPMGERAKTERKKSGTSVSSEFSRKSGSVSSDPISIPEEKRKERKSNVSSEPPIPEIIKSPKKPRPRPNPVDVSLASPRNDAPKVPKRRSSVMVERKVRELEERAARERRESQQLSPPKEAKKLNRKLSKGGSSKRFSSKRSISPKSNGS